MMRKVKSLLRKVKAIASKKDDRYPNLTSLIKQHRCKRIMEIGTWNGQHAKEMIRAAQKRFPKNEVEYYGFDLFELMTNDKFKEEFAKIPPSMKEVKSELETTGAKITLFKGDTNDTLPRHGKDLPKMDFIFIDGGHSIKTIENDWKHTRKLMSSNTIVVFDDYFKNNESEVEGIGCQSLIDSLDPKTYDIEFLKPECHFKKEWGTLNVVMVKVTLKAK